MLVVIHLSDIHFTAKDDGLARRNASLRTDVLNDIAKMRLEVGEAHAILVTGDIAYSGLPAEYDQARLWLDQVAEAAGAPISAIQVVPGNHDVHRKSVGAAGEFVRDKMRGTDPGRTDEVIDRLLDEDAETLLRPLRNFNEFAGEYRCEIGRNPYWQSEDIDLGQGVSLAIRGVTTVLASDARDIRPNMVVGRTQAVLPKDRRGRVYLVMGHHPPDWWHDQDAVLATFRGRCSILLCGHKHAQLAEQVDQMLRITAGAVHPEEDRSWEPRYNWLTIDVDTSEPDTRLVVRLWPRVFRENDFRPDYQEGGMRYAQYKLRIDSPEATKRAHDDPDRSAVRVVPGCEGEEQELPASVVRPPVMAAPGRSDPQRDVGRRLLRLPYTTQIRILQELQLLEDDDMDRSHVEMVTAAMRRAQQRDVIQNLDAAVTNAETTAT